MTARHTDCSVHAGVHDSGFRMSKQISPVLKATLGWKMRVTNETLGGASDVCSEHDVAIDLER